MSRRKLNRRRFLSVTAAVAGATSIPSASLAGTPAPPEEMARKYYNVLSLSRISFKASFEDSVALAAKHGFEGVDPDADYFSTLSNDGLSRILDNLKAKNLKLGDARLPVEFRRDEATFNEGLKNLPAAAMALEGAGVDRVSTYVLPYSGELTYPQNFRRHAVRLRECARVLADHGLRLGFEYVGPRSAWRSARHPFIHTLSETRELMVAIGTDNLAVQLDSYHWYNAEETVRDLETLRSRDITSVDLNDAPAGLARDQYQDLSRELPAATGVIPIKDFLSALVRIGFDGPIHAEPFNKTLSAMPIDKACAATVAAMKNAFALAGLV